MQFSFGHGAFHARRHPVIEQPRMVDAVRVGDQRVAHSAEIQQPVLVEPVPRLRREAGGFRERLANSNLRLAIVEWSARYEGPYPTTRQSLRILRGEYTVVPSPEPTA